MCTPRAVCEGTRVMTGDESVSKKRLGSAVDTADFVFVVIACAAGGKEQKNK